MKQYHDLLRSILTNGSPHADRTGVGTVSLFGHQSRFSLQDGFPLVTTKRVPFRWIAEELFWFLSGDTDESTLRDKGIDIWAEWADELHTSRFGRPKHIMGPIYGYLWRSFGGHYPVRDGVDQIAKLIHSIQHDPDSRRLLVTGWDPREKDNVDLPPCHTLFQFKVEDRRTLHCHLYSRSSDSFLGWPYNVAAYALLTHIIAHVCNLEVGDLIVSLGDTHIYHTHRQAVDELLSREPFPLPRLEIIDPDRRFVGIEGLLAIRYSDLNLVGYRSHAKISAPVAV